MADWSKRMDELEAELAAWESRYRAELERLDRARGLVRRLLRPAPAERERMESEATAAAGQDALRAAGAFLDELAELYLAEKSPQVRAAMRARIGGADRLFRALWEYAEEAPERIRGPGDEPHLRRALAAVVLDDLRVDLLRLEDLLGRLYVSASRSGIDPKPSFAAATAVANPASTGGGAHMKAFLGAFESSRYFKQHVAPRLRPASAVRTG